jgi:hypothetical protein
MFVDEDLILPPKVSCLSWSAHSGRGQPYLMYRFYHILLSVWPTPLIAFAWVEDIEDLLT